MGSTANDEEDDDTGDDDDDGVAYCLTRSRVTAVSACNCCVCATNSAMAIDDERRNSVATARLPDGAHDADADAISRSQ